MVLAEGQKSEETALPQQGADVPGSMPSVAGPPGAELEYAGFWRRLAAFVLDVAAVLLIGFVFAIIIPILLAPLVGLPSDLQIVIAIALFWAIVPWLYWAVMESSSRQATLGKSYLDIIVTDSNGQRISFVRASARYWAKVPSALLLLAGFIMAGFTSKKQALHDVITGSLLLIKEPRHQASGDSLNQ